MGIFSRIFSSRPVNAIKGMGNAASASFTSSIAGRGLKSALWGGKYRALAAGGGAVVGAAGGAAVSDNRPAGAIGGGFLGAAAGVGGYAAYNNRAGLGRMLAAAREGARRSF